MTETSTAATFAAVFVLFYIAHLLADYPLQTDRQASRKAGWTEGEGERATPVGTTTDGVRISRTRGRTSW